MSEKVSILDSVNSFPKFDWKNKKFQKVIFK